MQPPSDERSADDTSSLTIGYDPGRADRQLVGFGVATLIMVGLMALGVWMIAASFAQLETGGKVVGGGFGIFFVLLALVSLVSAAEVLTRIVRWSRQSEPLLVVDERGVAGLGVVRGTLNCGRPHIGWDEISSISLTSHAPGGRRTNVLARADPELRLRRAVKGGLDRSAGRGLGMRDGDRSIHLELVDGRTAYRDLRLPLGPQSFAELAPRIIDLARAHGVEVRLRGNLLA